MTAAIRATALILLLAAPVVLSTATRAQLNPTPCTSTAQCPDGLSCQPGFFGLKFCLFEYCNTDSTCTRPGALCTQGICRVPAGAGGGGGGSVGLGQSPVGGRCGPRKLGGGVIKSVGCQRGLHCTNGFCEQLR